MPTKPHHRCLRKAQLAHLAAALLSVQAAQAQTDDTTPFYFGGSLGAARVSNVYRQSSATNDDTVATAGLLGGIDQKFGRQHLTLDGSLQQNRYSENRDLNNRAYTLRTALDWQTVGHLSGVLSAKSERSLADFNIGGGVDPILKKNIEREDEYQALARLGMATRYSVEVGWLHRRRNFSAEEYERLNFTQNTGSLGLYGTPAGNVKLGVVARRTKGTTPRYPIGLAFDPESLKFVVVTAPNDYTRDDVDLTARWSVGGHSTLNARISRSKTKNSLDDRLRDFSGTTGSAGWTWQPTGKFQLNLQYARDTGQESVVRSADLNRVYTTWRLGGNYALTSKINLNANASRNRATRVSTTGTEVADALDDFKAYNVGLRWAFSRGLSLSCQYDHALRDSSVARYTYSASSYGCTAQAIFF